MTATSEVRLRGELDLAGAAYLRGLLAELGTGSITIDLSQLRLLDASGISVLVETRRRLEAAGHRLVLTGARGLVRRVFAIVGLEAMLLDRPASDDTDELSTPA